MTTRGVRASLSWSGCTPNHFPSKYQVFVGFNGLGMPAGFYQAVLQVDPCIREGDFFGRPRSCEFDGRVVAVEALDENM